MRDIWVDFNDVEPTSNWAHTHAMYAAEGADLSVGSALIAGDNDGNVCDATVLDVARNGIIILALDMGTFRQHDTADSVLLDR